MRLNTDPMLILEYFLWRMRSEYAISNHYDRHCVWEEVLQNKRLNKYNHSAIDEQFIFYQSDGLTKFDPSDPNNPIPSCACHWCPFFYHFIFYLVFLFYLMYMFHWMPRVNSVLCSLQMYLKAPLLCGPIHQCQIYFHAFGSMKLTVLLHVIN